MNNPIKDRIRKLLNLANNAGATEAEATSAMEMATALMLKYNIELDPEEDQLKVKEGPVVLENLDEAWHLVACQAAAYLFMTKVVVCLPKGFGFYFVGRPQNIEMAADTAKFIIDQVERQYKLHLPPGLDKSTRAEFRRTFKYACAGRIMQRAYEIVDSFKKSDAKALEYTGSRALVIVESIELQLKEAKEYLETRENLKNVTTRPRKGGNGTLAGIRAGDRVELNRKIV